MVELDVDKTSLRKRRIKPKPTRCLWQNWIRIVWVVILIKICFKPDVIFSLLPKQFICNIKSRAVWWNVVYWCKTELGNNWYLIQKATFKVIIYISTPQTLQNVLFVKRNTNKSITAHESVIKNPHFDDINEWLLKIKSTKIHVSREFMHVLYL